MRRTRPITVELARDADGLWTAVVPSLGISVSASTTDEALSRVRALAAEPGAVASQSDVDRDSRAA